MTVLTHCNTGSLATAGYGTALGVVRALHDMGKLEHCYACETRPYNQGVRVIEVLVLWCRCQRVREVGLVWHDKAADQTSPFSCLLLVQVQTLPHAPTAFIPLSLDNNHNNTGARLTAFELVHDGLPATLLVDSAAATAMAQGKIDAVVVGADRVVANGDTANKIGTFSHAVSAAKHGIPFFIAAPTTTLDAGLSTGDEIEIEQRPPEEITHFKGQRVVVEDIGVRESVGGGELKWVAGLKGWEGCELDRQTGGAAARSTQSHTCYVVPVVTYTHTNTRTCTHTGVEPLL